MKTKVSFVTLKNATLHDPKDEVHLRIRTGGGEMMTNRIVQLFSQYPRERLDYDLQLELEIIEEYTRSFYVGYSIIITLQDTEVAEDFIDAVYGYTDRKMDDIYLLFIYWVAEHLRACVSDWLKYGKFSISEVALKLSAELCEYPGADGADTQKLLKDLLKARRRIKKFILRHAKEAETRFMDFG